MDFEQMVFSIVKKDYLAYYGYTPILFSKILPDSGSPDNVWFNQKVPVPKCSQRAGSTQLHASCQFPNPSPSLNPKFSKIIIATSTKKKVGGY